MLLLLVTTTNTTPYLLRNSSPIVLLRTIVKPGELTVHADHGHHRANAEKECVLVQSTEYFLLDLPEVLFPDIHDTSTTLSV